MESFTTPSSGLDTTGDLPPGGVYLCQVSRDVSCGACCGLYNLFRRSREEMTEKLRRRSLLFSRTPRDVMAIDAFRRRIAAEESDPHPLPKFHHCSFLGLVGHGRSRVGCLLHPMGDGNEGIDFRGLSEYGGWACRSYFCPTHRRVRATHLEMVRNVLSHWYEYGLVVTEWKMLGHLFAELETWCETPLRWSDISENAACREILVELLTLKLSWPFRADADQPPVHYFFNDRLYSKPKTGGSAIGNDRSPFHALFYELHSVFVSRRQLHEAEAIVHRLLSRFRRHYR